MNLKEIHPPALYKLLGYLEAVSDFIRTGELKWYYDIRLVDIECDSLDIKLLIKSAYPGSNPETAQINESAFQNLVETLRHELGRRLKPEEVLKLLTPVTELRGEMWHYLGECVNYNASRVIEYTTSDALDDFGSGGIVGNFAFVIIDENQNRCLFLSGGDCD
jgi:hypothetical protein